MERHNHPKRSGSQSARSSEVLNEDSNDLRHLKTELGAEDTTKTQWRGGGRPPSTSSAVNWSERRASPRIRCSGSVEFRVGGTGVPIWGTLTDISLHGCYVEMNNTCPIDTKVILVLKSFGIRIEVEGVVRTSYPSLGMGIYFSKINPDEQHHLTQLIDALAGHRGSLPLHPTETLTTFDAVSSAEPAVFLREVTEFFRTNQLLSREEFRRIAQRTCASQSSVANASG